MKQVLLLTISLTILWSTGISQVDLRRDYYNIGKTPDEGFPTAVTQEKGGLWGFVDSKTGKIVIPMKYQNVRDHFTKERGIVIVENEDGKYGAINAKGKEVIPFEYAYLYHFTKDIYAASNGDKRGLINVKNELVMDYKYDIIAEPFDDTKASVYNRIDKYDRYCGFITLEGKELMPPVFKPDEGAYKIKYYQGIYMGKIDYGKYRFYKESVGWLNEHTYTNAEPFDENGQAKVQREAKTGYIDLKGVEHWTGVDKKEALEIAKRKYDKTADFINGYARVKKGGKYGFLNKKGELVIPLEYSGAFEFDNYPVVGVAKNGKQGYINFKNEVVIPIVYDKVTKPSNGLIGVIKDGKYGFFNTDGQKKLDCIYDDASPFKSGISLVKKGELYGAINTKGDFVIPLEFSKMGDGFKDGLLKVKKNGKYGFVNSEGKIIIPLKYSLADDFEKGRSIVKDASTGYFKVINILGEKLFEVEESIQSLEASHSELNYYFTKNNKIGVLDTDGQVLTHNYIRYFEDEYKDGTKTIRSSKGIGLVDSYGEVIIPPIMGSIKETKHGFYIVQKGSYYGLYHTQKKQVVGLVLESLSYYADEYHFKLETTTESSYGHTRLSTEKGFGKITSYDDNAWSKLKVDGSSLSSKMIFGASDKKYYKTYIFNDTPYDLYVYHRPEGRSLEQDASEEVLKPGGYFEVEAHKTGSIFLSGEAYNIHNAKTILSMSGPTKAGSVLLLSDYLSEIGKSLPKMKVQKTDAKIIKHQPTENYTSNNGGDSGPALTRVKKNGKYGFVNSANETIIPFEYDGAFEFGVNTKIVGVKKGDFQGYINKNNEIVLPLEFNNVFPVSEGMIRVKKDGKYGFYTTKGKIAIQIVCDVAEDFSNGKAYIEKDGKTGYVNKEGKVTWE